MKSNLKIFIIIFLISFISLITIGYTIYIREQKENLNFTGSEVEVIIGEGAPVEEQKVNVQVEWIVLPVIGLIAIGFGAYLENKNRSVAE